jgi:hypothetical protein
MKHLERDYTIVLCILGKENSRHTTTTELPVDGVRLRQCITKSLDW